MVSSAMPRRDGGDAHHKRDCEVIDKTLATCTEAVEHVFDGATVMIGGFGDPGMPGQLIEAVRRQGAANLGVGRNGPGAGDYALGGLFQDGRVRKLLASFPAPRGTAFRDRYLKGEIELELVPRRHSARDRTQCIRATAFWPKARG